jgi:hypothetical protein
MSANELVIQSFDVMDNEIPDAVLQQQPPQTKPAKRATTQTSNFLITANPNISWRELQDKATRITAAKKLISFGKNLEVNLRNHLLLKEFVDKPFPNVKRFEFSIETGDKNGFLHLHAFVLFDGYCMLRLPALPELLNRIMAPLSKGGKVFVQPFKDVAETVKNYVHKHSNALYSTTNTTNEPAATPV